MIYLASQSPRRAELLRHAIGADRFQVVASRGDEESVQGLPPQLIALERARVKAEGAVLPAGTDPTSGDGLVLGADTVVALGATLFGKPRDRADAVEILNRLQGTTHQVYTGHCCVGLGRLAGRSACGVAVARIVMRKMSREQIEAYVATGASDGKAGAYAIQEGGDRFVAELQGGFDTVVGLSLSTFARLHRELTDTDLPVLPNAPRLGTGAHRRASGNAL